VISTKPHPAQSRVKRSKIQQIMMKRSGLSGGRNPSRPRNWRGNHQPTVEIGRTAAELDETSPADFCWMVDAGASVTGSLQFAKLCSIYLTVCSGGL
jgi:hypothetical protein